MANCPFCRSEIVQVERLKRPVAGDPRRDDGPELRYRQLAVCAHRHALWLYNDGRLVGYDGPIGS